VTHAGHCEYDGRATAGLTGWLVVADPSRRGRRYALSARHRRFIGGADRTAGSVIGMELIGRGCERVPIGLQEVTE